MISQANTSAGRRRVKSREVLNDLVRASFLESDETESKQRNRKGVRMEFLSGFALPASSTCPGLLCVKSGRKCPVGWLDWAAPPSGA